VVLRRALRALDREGGRERRPTRKPSTRERERRQVLLSAISETPEVRATMLALLCELSVEDVERDLKTLEDAGRIQRKGLGWVVKASAS
jgi:DeoR/GlpR family transcriptional regulator of sugar metabolism